MSSHPKRLLLGAAGLALLLFAAVATAGVDRHTNRAEVSGSLRVVSNWTGSEGEAFQEVVNGFKKAYPNVDVRIEAHTDDADRCLHVIVSDDGAGAPPVASGAGLGLALVRQRLEAAFGPAAQLVAERTDAGFVVTLRVPQPAEGA